MQHDNAVFIRFYGLISSSYVTKLRCHCTREKLLRLILEDPRLTTEELAARLSLTRKGVEWQIRKLKADGAIRRVGPDKGGHWEVRK